MAASGDTGGTAAGRARKLESLQALRAVAVLAVVLFHLLTIEERYGGSARLLPGWLGAGQLGVDLFFVISGFVMVTVTRGRFRSAVQARRFLWHRLTRIYPLYWVYTTLALAVFLVQPAWVNSSQGNQVDVIASYLLLPQPLLPLVQVGWTLVHEVYFYLVYAVVLRFLAERHLPAAMLGWAALVILLGTVTLGPWWNVAFSPLTLEFIAGCLLASWLHRSGPLPVPGGALVGVAAVALLVAVAGYQWFFTQHGVPPTGWAQLVLYGIPAVVIVGCLVSAEARGIGFPRPVVATGDASYSIYLSHLFVINAVGRLWEPLAGEGVLDNAVVLALTMGLVLLVGAMSYRFLELPLLRLSRRVT